MRCELWLAVLRCFVRGLCAFFTQRTIPLTILPRRRAERVVSQATVLIDHHNIIKQINSKHKAQSTTHKQQHPFTFHPSHQTMAAITSFFLLLCLLSPASAFSLPNNFASSSDIAIVGCGVLGTSLCKQLLSSPGFEFKTGESSAVSKSSRVYDSLDKI